MSDSQHQPQGPQTAWTGKPSRRLLVVETERMRLAFRPPHGADRLELRHPPSDLDVLRKNPLVSPRRTKACALLALA